MPGVSSEAAYSLPLFPSNSVKLLLNTMERAGLRLVANPAAHISKCGTTCSLKGECVTARMFIFGKDHVQQISAMMSQYVQSKFSDILINNT